MMCKNFLVLTITRIKGMMVTPRSSRLNFLTILASTTQKAAIPSNMYSIIVVDSVAVALYTFL